MADTKRRGARWGGSEGDGSEDTEGTQPEAGTEGSNGEVSDANMVTPAQLAKDLGVTAGTIYSHINASVAAAAKAAEKGETFEDPFPGVKQEVVTIKWTVNRTAAIEWLRRREAERIRKATERASKFGVLGTTAEVPAASEPELAEASA